MCDMIWVENKDFASYDAGGQYHEKFESDQCHLGSQHLLFSGDHSDCVLDRHVHQPVPKACILAVGDVGTNRRRTFP